MFELFKGRRLELLLKLWLVRSGILSEGTSFTKAFVRFAPKCIVRLTANENPKVVKHIPIGKKIFRTDDIKHPPVIENQLREFRRMGALIY